MWNINIFSFILLFNALLSAILCIYVIRKKTIKGKIFFVHLMIALVVWSLFDSLGYATDDLDTKILLAKFAYFGVVSVAPFFFMFFYNFLQGDKKLSIGNIILIWIIPVIILILAFTNEYHLLIWSSITLIPGTNGVFTDFEHGTGVYINMLYSYSIIIVILYKLIKIAYLYRKVYRNQAIIMIVATVVPLAGNFLYVFKLNPYPALDVTPFLFTITAFMITWGFTSFRFLDTKPVAHSLLFQNMTDCVLVLDGYLKIAEVNPSFEELFGMKGLIGKSSVEAFISYPGLLKIFGEKREGNYEIPICINGKNLYLDVRTTPMLDWYNDIIGMLIVLRDITARKKDEAIIKESEKNLKETIATKDRFFSIIAHDLRSPFSALLGLSEILRNDIDELTDFQRKDFADIMYRSANSTYKLIENLLEWTSLQTGKFKIKNERFNLWEVSSEICNALFMYAMKKKIEIINKIPKDTIIISDKNMLKLLFNNLITNAIKFSYSGGKIELSSEFENEALIVAVKDYGTGIKNEDMDKLFKADTSFSLNGTEKERGTGLGLILCREAIEKAGGNIFVESEEGKGSCFKFVIPYITENKESQKLLIN